MITFYAAVGIFETGTEAGAKRPVLLRAGRKYDVTLPEFVLWSSLLWNIYHYDEIKAVYGKKIAEAQVRDASPFDEVLEQMTRRGLVGAGTGYTGIEALYELLSGMFLVPVHTPALERLRGFLYLTFVRRIPLRVTGRLFGKAPLTPQERAVWDLISQRSMSTAELIRCVELEVTDVSTGSKIVDAIYNAGDGVDYKNVDVHSRFSDKRAAVIDAVPICISKSRCCLKPVIRQRGLCDQ